MSPHWRRPRRRREQRRTPSPQVVFGEAKVKARARPGEGRGVAPAPGPPESAAPPKGVPRRRWLSFRVVAAVLLGLFIGMVAGIWVAAAGGFNPILLLPLVVLGEAIFTLVVALLAARFLFRRRPYGAPPSPQRSGRRPR